jgi:hypothetical protein
MPKRAAKTSCSARHRPTTDSAWGVIRRSHTSRAYARRSADAGLRCPGLDVAAGYAAWRYDSRRCRSSSLSNIKPLGDDHSRGAFKSILRVSAGGSVPPRTIWSRQHWTVRRQPSSNR